MATCLEELEKSLKTIKAEKEKIKRTRKGLASNYGGNVRKYRKEAGLTQADLADYIGLSRPMLIGIETGTQLGSLEMVAPSVVCRCRVEAF